MTTTTTTPYEKLRYLGAPVLPPDKYFKIYTGREITYFEQGLRVTLYQKRKHWFDKRLGTTIVLYNDKNIGWTPQLIADLCKAVYEKATPPSFFAIKPFFGKQPNTHVS